MSFVPFLAAFVITLLTTPMVARFTLARGILGVDLHKDGSLKIPEMGGIAVFFSVLLVLIYHYQIGFGELLTPIIAIYIIGTLGMIDGLTKLTALQKITSFTAVGIFLTWGLGYRSLPVMIFLAFLFMSTVNFTNMLAGLNGLEIGTGAIASIGLSIVSYQRGAQASFFISSAMAGALLGFLYYNRYPARVFPGDVGTLIIGSALFSAILMGRLYIPGLLVFIPYVADAALKFLSAGVMTRESQKPTEHRHGKLYVPKGTNLSLTRVFLRRRAMSEVEVVRRVWLVEAVFAALAVAYGVIL